MHRQKLDRGHAETANMIENSRLGQAPKRAPKGFGDCGMMLGVAAHMQLIDDRTLPSGTRWAVFSPGEGRIDDPASRHERGTVAVVECQVVAGLELVAKNRRIPIEIADHRLGVRVEQELVVVEPVAAGWF